MSIEQEHIRHLWQRVISGQATEEERLRLDELVADEEHKHVVEDLLQQVYDEMEDADRFFSSAEKEAMMREIVGKQPAAPVRILRKWRRVAAAAVFLGMVTAGVYYLAQPVNHPVVAVPQEIAPGSNGAVLTLANGSQLVLDSVDNGLIASQQGAQVVMKNGQLLYDPVNESSGNLAYNTMTTPKGRQFGLVLPDGSRVWLNAASSLKYPTAFTGKERVVELTGEAYFEVARNAAQPFRVSVQGRAAVEVLGTHFNVNAYENEAVIKATLLQGSIRLRGEDAVPVILKPGQQGVLQRGAPVLVQSADVDKAMAWKNGIFNFNDASLQEVMRQLERWYNIEVVYEKGIPDKYFYGKVSRDMPLSGVLKALEATRVHFRIEQGRKLVVMP